MTTVLFNNFLLNLFFDSIFFINFLIPNMQHLNYMSSVLVVDVDIIRFIFFKTLLYIIDLNFSIKLAMFVMCKNMDIINFFFFIVTPVTFWMFPAILLLLTGILNFFFIEINSPNTIIFKFTYFFLKFIFLYQFCLLIAYMILVKAGFYFLVGSNNFYIIPINLNLMKLFCIFFCTFLLILTLWLCDYFFNLTKNIIKFEIYSIICFLGFSLNMIFLQTDLFSIFVYMEIISLCIYVFLFVQK